MPSVSRDTSAARPDEVHIARNNPGARRSVKRPAVDRSRGAAWAAWHLFWNTNFAGNPVWLGSRADRKEDVWKIALE
jgi:hypothetical protein